MRWKQYNELNGGSKEGLYSNQGNFTQKFGLDLIFRIFGPSILVAQLTGILLSAMSVIFVFLIGKEAGKKQLGFIAAIMWSLMPSRIFYSLLNMYRKPI